MSFNRDLFEPEPQKAWRKGIEPIAGGEYVVFKNYLTEHDVEELRNQRYRLFFLTKGGPTDVLDFGHRKFATRATVDNGEYLLLEATRADGET